jgi:hypothetical protein
MNQPDIFINIFYITKSFWAVILFRVLKDTIDIFLIFELF